MREEILQGFRRSGCQKHGVDNFDRKLTFYFHRSKIQTLQTTSVPEIIKYNTIKFVIKTSKRWEENIWDDLSMEKRKETIFRKVVFQNREINRKNYITKR